MSETKSEALEPTQEMEAAELSEVFRVRREKLAALQEAGKNPFEKTKYEVTRHAAEVIANFVDKEEGDETPGEMVRLAGRLMSKRGMGKAGFGDLADSTGRIQLYVRKDMIGEEPYADWKNMTSATLSGSRARSSAPTPVRSASRSIRWSCCQNPSCPCRRSGMA